MIGVLSKHSKALMIVIMVPIIITFVFWGAGQGGGGRNNPIVGTIMGKKVLLQELQEAAKVVSLSGNVKQENLFDLAWQHLALAQEAEAWGITVTDAEVRDGIQRAFVKDGQFDMELYQQVLANRGVTASDFEKQMRQKMKVDKLQRLVLSTTAVTPQEVRQQYDFINSRIKIQYSKVTADNLVPALSSESAAKDYYLRNRETFKRPRRVKAQYVVITTDKVSQDMPTFSDQDMQAYYQQHSDDYKDASGAVQPFDAVKNRVKSALKKQTLNERVLARAKELFAGKTAADMKDVAEEQGLSIRFSAYVGDTAFVDEYLEENTAFAQTALKTPLDSTSNVVMTAKGAVVLCPIEILEPGYEDFDAVKNGIIADIEKTADAERISAFNQSFSVQDYQDSGYDLLSIAKDNYADAYSYFLSTRENNPRLSQPEQRRVQYILVDPNDAARFMIKEAISEDDIAGYYRLHKDEFLDEDSRIIPFAKLSDDARAGIIAKLKERYMISQEEISAYYDENQAQFTTADGTVQTLDAVQQTIVSTLEEQKKYLQAQAFAQDIFVIYRPERMRWLADKNNLPIRETELFGMDDAADEYIGADMAFIQAAFSTTVGEVSDIVETDKGFAIISPIEKYPVEAAPATLADVYDVVNESVVETEASKLAYGIARDRYNNIQRWMRNNPDASFDSACQELGYDYAESDLFSRMQQYVPGVGSIASLSTATRDKTVSPFEMELNKLSQVKRVSDGALFFMVSGAEYPTDDEFESEKERYENYFLNLRQREVLQEWMVQLMDKYKIRPITG